MFSNKTKRAFFGLFCCLFTLFSTKAASQAPIRMRVIETKDMANNPLEKNLIKVALESIHKSERIDVLPAGSTDGAATHLVEATGSSAVKDRGFSITGFVDSTKIMRFSYRHALVSRVTLLVTEVETGRILKSVFFDSEASFGENLELGYDKTGWAKGLNQKDEKLKAAALERGRAALIDRFKNNEKKVEEELLKNNARNAARVVLRLFPYRLEVLEATEIDKDDAEKVRISGGKKFDLSKGDNLICYVTRDLRSGEKTFEHYDILGRLKFEKEDEKGTICDVKRGKERILAALNAKKKVYCTAGTIPFTAAKADERQPQLAVASIIFPKKADDETRETLYRHLRFELLSIRNMELLERQKLAVLQAEKDLQKREEFMDKSAVDQYKSVGADLLLEIKFAEPKLEVSRDSDTKKATEATVNFTFQNRLLLVETGEVIEESTGRAQRRYANSNTSAGIQADPTLAKFNENPRQPNEFFLQEALRGMTFGANGFMKSALPPRVIVAEMTDTKKDKADEVLVIGDFNADNNEKYYVMRKRIIEVDGQKLPRFEQIGLIALRGAEGEGVAEAKVKDGGKAIFEAITAGEILFCTDKPDWMDRLSKWGNNRAEKYGY